MQVLWSHSPATANQVVQSLAGQTDWKPKTIHTLLRRLVEKNAARYVKQGREFLFSPCVQAAECEQAVTRSFIRRFFRGDPMPFLARFLQEEKLKPEQIQELRRLLERKAR